LGGRGGAVTTGSRTVVEEGSRVASAAVEVVCFIWADVVVVVGASETVVEVAAVEAVASPSGTDSVLAQPATNSQLMQKNQIKRISKS